MKSIFASLILTTCFLATSTYAEEAKKANEEKPVYGCYEGLGLETANVFKEEYDTLEECAKLCKGGATVCQKLARKSQINETRV